MTRFENICREAAASFLQTVVLVDDRAEYGSSDAADHDALQAPDEDEDNLGAQTPDEPFGPVVGRPKTGADLDAGIITTGFASKGLVCAVLKPGDEHSLSNETQRAAERADIVVLDWEMKDHGERAIEIMKAIKQADETEGSRLRLLAIYTSRSPLKTISDRVLAELESFTRVDPSDDSNLAITSSSLATRIVFLSKGRNPAAPENEFPLAVEFEALPDRMITEFAKFSGGLLPNTTIAAMGELRRHTHRMLARFNKSMDAPLLTHRLLSSHSSDADSYIGELIFQEIESQISLSSIARRYTGPESMHAYFENRSLANNAPQVNVKSGPSKNKMTANYFEIPSNVAVDIIEGNTASFEEFSKEFCGENSIDPRSMSSLISGRPENRLESIKLIACGSEEEYEKSHDDFSIISNTRRSAGDYVSDADRPRLKLGTVIKDSAGYMVCITPVCDSVRLDEMKDNKQKFSFVRLHQGEKRFSIVLPEKEGKVRLSLDRKRLHLETIEFCGNAFGFAEAEWLPDGALGFVEAPADKTEENEGAAREAAAASNENAEGAPADENNDAKPAPTLGDTRRIYHWAADLKMLQAQRIVGSVGSHLSRIGLDEFEWLRLQSGSW